MIMNPNPAILGLVYNLYNINDSTLKSRKVNMYS